MIPPERFSPVHARVATAVERSQTDRIRVTCAVPYSLGIAPAQRFRWEQWAPLLADEGVQLDFVPFGTPALEAARARGETVRAVSAAVRRFPRWWMDVAATTSSDALVVSRNAALAGPPVAEFLMSRGGKPFVYDFDDAIYLRPEHGDDRLRRILRADWRVSVLCRRATLVSVGSPVLKDWAIRFNPRTVVWPTTIRMAEYRARPEPVASAEPVIGWMGSRTTAPYLSWLLPTLRELQRRHPFRLFVVGAAVDLQGVRGDCVPWSAATEVSSLHEMDVGLMPLPDSPWTRGKCAAKALQYLGVGVPAVVSDVGVNREAVPDGVAGFVVRTPDEWLSRLEQLLRDPALRQRLGHAGRAHVARNYSAEVWAPRIAAELKALVERAQERTR